MAAVRADRLVLGDASERRARGTSGRRTRSGTASATMPSLERVVQRVRRPRSRRGRGTAARVREARSDRPASHPSPDSRHSQMAAAVRGNIHRLPDVWESIASQELGPTPQRIPSRAPVRGPRLGRFARERAIVARLPGWLPPKPCRPGRSPAASCSLIDALVARGQLSLGRPDLPARQPAAARAAGGRARQAAAARPLGHDAGPQPALGASQPRHPGARPRRPLRDRARSRRAGRRRQRLSRGHLQRALRADRPRRGAGCSGSSGSSRSPGASRATPRPRRPVRSTRAVSSATRSRMPSAPRSTTPA